MEIDKVQLLILTILVDSGADSPGTGMTLKEIASELNNNSDHKEYVTSKLKVNKADMFYITSKGKSIKEVLFNGEQ